MTRKIAIIGYGPDGMTAAGFAARAKCQLFTDLLV